MSLNKVIIGDAELYCGDCRDILPTLPKVDAVVTDPPYGIGMDGGNVGYKGFNNLKKKGWDKEVPDDELFALILKAGSKVIIWGGNYFKLPPSRCYLIWDKGTGLKGRSYAEAELAWTSMDANVQILYHDPLARRDYKGKEHPTQKPIAVMEWCITHAGNPQSVLDPFMGSGSTGVACWNLGSSFIGIECDPEYFDIACRRIEDAQRQKRMFA